VPGEASNISATWNSTPTRRSLWVGLRPIIAAHSKLEAFERDLAAPTTLEECWQAIETGARSLGYSQIDGRLDGVRFGRTRPAHRQRGLLADAP